MVGTLGPGLGYGKAARFQYTATGGQTTFVGADQNGLTMRYTPGYVEVAVNGVWLPPTDYTATDGSSIVLPTPCIASDIVYVYALTSFTALLNPFPMPGAIWGCIMSTAGSSATLTVGAGIVADSTNTYMMQLKTALAKTTGAWVAGAGGGLDTSTIAINTWYHWFVIYNQTTAVVDVVFSATATPSAGPSVMPAGFTHYRRIGSMRTNASSQWMLFHQFGDEFLWDAPITDANAVASINGSALTTLTVPVNIQVGALFSARQDFVTVGNALYFTSPDVPATTSGGALTELFSNASITTSAIGIMNLRTSTAGQIRVTGNAAGCTYNIVTNGWTDTRGRLQ